MDIDASTCDTAWDVPNKCTFACAGGHTASGTIMTCTGSDTYTADAGVVPPTCTGTPLSPQHKTSQCTTTAYCLPQYCPLAISEGVAMALPSESATDDGQRIRDCRSLAFGKYAVETVHVLA